MGQCVSGSGTIYLKEDVDAKEAFSAIRKSANKYEMELTEMNIDEEGHSIQMEFYDSRWSWIHWSWIGVDDFFAEIVPLVKEGNIDFEGDGDFIDVWRYHFYPEQNQWKHEVPELVYNREEYIKNCSTEELMAELYSRGYEGYVTDPELCDETGDIEPEES